MIVSEIVQKRVSEKNIIAPCEYYLFCSTYNRMSQKYSLQRSRSNPVADSCFPHETPLYFSKQGFRKSVLVRDVSRSHADTRLLVKR